MKNEVLALSPTRKAVTIQGTGSGFWYESATVAGGDSRISVKTAKGDEFTLRPGQSARLPYEVESWYVSLYDTAATITGNIITGSGEFNDNNTTIAAGAFSVTNFPANQSVTVTNNNAAAVPVTKQAYSTLSNANGTVGTGAAVSISNDATLRRLIIRNTHATGIMYLGGAGVTSATSAIQLKPGESWIEDDAAGANWYATADTASTSYALQGLK